MRERNSLRHAKFGLTTKDTALARARLEESHTWKKSPIVCVFVTRSHRPWWVWRFSDRWTKWGNNLLRNTLTLCLKGNTVRPLYLCHHLHHHHSRWTPGKKLRWVMIWKLRISLPLFVVSEWTPWQIWVFILKELKISLFLFTCAGDGYWRPPSRPGTPPYSNP